MRHFFRVFFSLSFFLYRVQIHRIILATTSEYFEIILNQKIVDSHDIILADIGGDLIKQIVSFAYTGKIKIYEQNVTQCAMAAVNLELNWLLKKCNSFFYKNLSIRNCIDWFVFAANKESFRELRQKAFQMICKKFDEISSLQMNLIKLEYEDFKEMIAASENSAPEEAIFERMVQWVEIDASARGKYVSDLLSCIRLELISAEVSNRIESHFWKKTKNCVFLSMQALIMKVDVFCKKYGLIGFTEKECHNRLLGTKSLCQYRIDKDKTIFEISGRRPLYIQRYNLASERWEYVCQIIIDKLMVPSDREQMFGSGVVVGKEKLYIIGGLNSSSVYSKRVSTVKSVDKTEN